MNKILLIENNPNIEKMYALNLKTYLDFDIVIEKDAQSAIKTGHFNLDLKLIICRYKINKEESANIIKVYLEKNNIKIPFIVIGNADQDEKLKQVATIMPSSVDLKAIIKNSAKLLQVTAKDMASKIVPEYYPIPVEYFKNINVAICDIYKTFILEENKKGFEKIFNSGDEFKEDDILKKSLNLKNEKDEFFFVNRDHRLKIVNQMTNKMINEMTQEQLSSEERVMAGQLFMDDAKKLIEEIGINHETITMIDNTVTNIAQNISESQNLESLIKNLSKNKASYLFKHTQVLTYIYFHLVKNLDWGKKMEIDKISFIAFFHDICLLDDKMAKIKNQKELNISDLSANEKLTVINHAAKASELVKNYPKAPIGVEQIICQHHGALNGIGFPQSYSVNLAPPVIAFLVAEEYTDQILLNENNKLNKSAMITHVHSCFSSQRFKKIIDVLDKITV